MGLTISYNHRTRDKAKIEALIKDLKIFAENTGRTFQEGVSKGFLVPPSETIKLDGTIEKGETYTFYDESLRHLEREGEKTVQRWFSIEIKSASHGDNITMLDVGWAKHGTEWVCNDWHKLWGPSGGNEEQIAKTVIEMDAILEYIKKYYFPDFKIHDEFDFYVNYKDQSETQKKFWKDIIAGKYPNYRRTDGTFPDYEKEYRALKNHEIKNIFKSIGDINQVFGKIEGELAKAGWGKDQIAKDMPLNPTIPTGVTRSYIPIGDQMVIDIHNTILNARAQIERKRILTIREHRIPIKRRDGIVQHYHKKLEHKQ